MNEKLISISTNPYSGLMNKMDERYQILKGIAMLEPVGRRSLADYLKETERHIRSETEFLDAKDY